MHVRKCTVCECQQIVMNGLTRKCVTLKWIKSGKYLAVHFVLRSHPAGLKSGAQKCTKTNVRVMQMLLRFSVSEGSLSSRFISFPVIPLPSYLTQY